MEDPHALLRRLKLGREEYCQRLLTMLILDGDYPRWNTRSAPSATGLAFLRALDELSFGGADVAEDAVFVDELDLPRRSEDEPGCAPDYGVLAADRLWIIELKTERGSVRSGQVESYFELGRHHYPELRVDLTYLTPGMSAVAVGAPSGSRFVQVTWEQVMPLINDAWSERDRVDGTRSATRWPRRSRASGRRGRCGARRR